jgi:hypothetical protein
MNRATRPFAAVVTSVVLFASSGEQIKVTLDGTDTVGKKVHAEWTGKYDVAAR